MIVRIRKEKARRVKTGKGPAYEVYRLNGKPTRFRYRKKLVVHKGKRVRMRYGFRGKKKLTEIAFVKPKRR